MDILNNITGISMTIVMLIAITLDYSLAIVVKRKNLALISTGMAEKFGKKLLFIFIPVIVQICATTLDYYVPTFTIQDFIVVHWALIIFTIIMLIQEYISIRAYLALTNPKVLKALDNIAENALPKEVINKAKAIGLITDESEGKK